MFWKLGAAMTLAIVAVVAVSRTAIAEGPDGPYRGMIVCEKLKASQFILRAPLDITITGKTVIAVHPIFNRSGSLVVGSEIATGNLADDGSIKLNSSWKAGGASYQGNYDGVITDKGGTLTGTQVWTRPSGQETRACTVAVIPIHSLQ